MSDRKIPYEVLQALLKLYPNRTDAEIIQEMLEKQHDEAETIQALAKFMQSIMVPSSDGAEVLKELLAHVLPKKQEGIVQKEVKPKISDANLAIGRFSESVKRELDRLIQLAPAGSPVTTERFFVITENSGLANTTMALLTTIPGGEIGTAAKNAKHWYIVKHSIKDLNQSSYLVIWLKEDEELISMPPAEKITLHEAFNMLKPAAYNDQMRAFAQIAFDNWKNIQEAKRKEARGTIPTECVPVPAINGDVKAATLFFPGKWIIAQQKDSERWVATQYFGCSFGKFHVTNGLKVMAIASFDTAMLGVKGRPTGFSYWAVGAGENEPVFFLQR